jgi:hypothetical protein
LTGRFADFRRGLLLLFCLAGFWTGCQDEDAFSLGSAGVGLTKSDDAAKDATADSCLDLSGDDAVIHAMLDAVNAERAKHQLAPLRLDPALADLADFYACRLVEGGFFDHQDPFDGSTIDGRAANFGYAFLKIGENLAAGQRTMEAVMADWMASPEHRSNILDPAFMDIGIGVKLGGECGIYWVQEFGRPISAAVEAASTKPAVSSAPASSQKAQAVRE